MTTEIDDIDVYHPDSLTPAQQQVLRRGSPVQTRSRSRAIVDEATLIHYALTQMTLRQGIKKHGERAKDAMQVELKQLHERNVLCPVEANTLTEEHKKRCDEATYVPQGKA